MRLPNLPRLNRFTVMLIIAVLLAGAAAFLTVHYLQNREHQFKTELQTKLSANMVDVVVPTANVHAGTVATNKNMAIRPVPRDLIYSSTITVARWGRYAGRILTHPVEAGRPLLAEDFAKPYNGDFASTLPTDMRAITIDVGGVNALAGLIRPGDRVDVLLVKTGNGGSGNAGSLIPLLHRALVLATGQNTKFTPLLVHDNNVLEAQTALDSYGNITLQVTPDQAAQLALAQQAGQLRIVLSPHAVPADAPQIPSLSEAALSNGGTAGGDSEATVQYIIGGGSGNVASQTEGMGAGVPSDSAAPASATQDSASKQRNAMKKAVSGLQSILHLDQSAAAQMQKGMQ